MLIKTSELVGPALDWAAAQVCIDPQDAQIGLPHVTFDAAGPWIWGAGREQRGTVNKETGKLWVFPGPGGRFEPSTDWSQGGLLIDKFGVEFEWITDATIRAEVPACGSSGFGRCHLTAACRAIVAAKLGDTIDVPEDICHV